MVPLSSQSARRWLLVAGLLVLVGLSGCSGLSGDGPELPDGEEAVERFSSVGVYNVTQITETTVDNETRTTRIEQTLRPATGERYQVARQNGTRTVSVSNNTTTWVYRPDREEVTRIIQDDERPQRVGTEQLRALVDSLETEDPEGAIAPIAPLFGATSADEGGLLTETNFTDEPMRTQYQGVETVAGRETYVVQLESAPDANRTISQTLYYDVEYFVPLRTEYELTTGDRQIEGEMNTQRTEFSPTVDDSVFEFDPPANATVRTTRLDRFQSYDELERAAESRVPAPEPPERFEFDSGTLRFEFDSGTLTERGLTLRYSDGASTVVVSRSSRNAQGVDSEQIEYEGRTYRYSNQYQRNVVSWQCGESRHTVAGNLERDRLLAVGASVECPAETGGRG